MYGSMTARLRVSPPCAAAAAQSGRSKAVITAQSKGEAIKVARISRRSAGLLSGAALLSIGLGRANAEDLGETILKLEAVEPTVAEELTKIEAAGGIEEVKDIVADIVDVEGQLETLEKKVEGLGGEADPLGLAQATEPLKQRLKELGDLIALFTK